MNKQDNFVRTNSVNSANVNDNEKGFLKIRVTTGLGKYPIGGAKVTVYAPKGGDLVPIQTETTDSQGNCPIIQLPVRYDPEVENMDPVYYYTDYSFSVANNNYYPTATYSVQMFPGITTEFDVNMNPVPAVDRYTDRSEQVTIPKLNM
jgi:hypothetical protein